MLRMDSDTFDQAIVRLRMNKRVRDMARAVLVDGKPQAQIARDHGVTRQAVNDAVQRVVREALQLDICPTCGRPL